MDVFLVIREDNSKIKKIIEETRIEIEKKNEILTELRKQYPLGYKHHIIETLVIPEYLLLHPDRIQAESGFELSKLDIIHLKRRGRTLHGLDILTRIPFLEVDIKEVEMIFKYYCR